MIDVGKWKLYFFVVSNDLLSCMDEVRMVTGGLRPPYFLLVRVSVCVCQMEALKVSPSSYIPVHCIVQS